MKAARLSVPPILFALLIVAYLQPWIINGSAALNLTAYDLAEWASLHPAAVAQTPPLLTSLLLRLPLACAGVWLAWYRPHSGAARILVGVIVTLIAIGLLPPPEYLGQRDNPNYQQQAGLATLTLAAALAGLFAARRVKPIVRTVVSVIALVGGLVAALGGLSLAVQWMGEYGLPAIIGSGAIMMGVCFAVTALLCLLSGARDG